MVEVQDWTVLPWDGSAQDYAAVAAGQVTPPEVAQWQAQAQRVTFAHAGGVLTDIN